MECGAVADEQARGWGAYRADLTPEAEAEDTSAADVPAVVYYFGNCGSREFETWG